MEEVANKNNIPIKALSATAIVVIHTPKGLLVTHIGDGRAGYKNKEGNEINKKYPEGYFLINS